MSTKPVPRPGPAQRGQRGSGRRRGGQRQATLPVSNETSAGGLAVKVEDGIAYVACIARRNRSGKLEWCLPKGHIEEGETPEEAARREVEEETGIAAVIVRALGVIDYWFTGDDRRIHKVVHHFLLEATGGEITTANDPDREAELAEWIPMSELPTRLAFPNERKMALAAAKLLAAES